MKKTFKKMLVTIFVVSMLLAVIGCSKKEPNPESNTEEITEATVEETSETEETDLMEEVTEEIIPEDTETPVHKFWNGDWYGYIWIAEADGGLAQWQNSFWDAMATIDVAEMEKLTCFSGMKALVVKTLLVKYS